MSAQQGAHCNHHMTRAKSDQRHNRYRSIQVMQRSGIECRAVHRAENLPGNRQISDRDSRPVVIRTGCRRGRCLALAQSRRGGKRYRARRRQRRRVLDCTPVRLANSAVQIDARRIDRLLGLEFSHQFDEVLQAGIGCRVLLIPASLGAKGPCE